MMPSTFSRAVLAAVVGLGFAASAAAQWQWIDKDGRKVFSDRMPPGDIPDKSILKRPAGVASLPAPVVVDAAAASTSTPPALKASAPLAGASTPAAGKDPQLEARKKQAEAEEAAKKKAEEEKGAKARTENCALAKRGLATMDSGVRVITVNAKGEREFMDDAARAAETKRLKEIAAADCK
jgi:hypothetical protein